MAFGAENLKCWPPPPLSPLCNVDDWNKQQRPLTALFTLIVYNAISVFPPVNASGTHSVSIL